MILFTIIQLSRSPLYDETYIVTQCAFLDRKTLWYCLLLKRPDDASLEVELVTPTAGSATGRQGRPKTGLKEPLLDRNDLPNEDPSRPRRAKVFS